MKNSLSSKVRNTVTGVMILSGILGTTKSALAQNLASNSNTSTNTGFNNTSLSIASTSALGVIKTQIKNFPQDLQAHYQNCLDKLYGQEEIDAVNNLLNEHIFKNITDPQEQVVWAIECLETVVLKGRITSPAISLRAKTNTTKNEANRQYKINFRTGYLARFESFKPLLEKKINELKQAIDQSKQNIDQSKQNIDQSKQNIDQSKQNIEIQKQKFIERLKRAEQEIILGKISNQEFAGLINSIKSNAKIGNIDIQKNYPNIRKKMQEVEKI